MHRLLMFLMWTALWAYPSLAAVDIKLVADCSAVEIGETTTVRLLARGTAGGVASAAGYIQATTGDGGGLTAVPDSFVWVQSPRSFLSLPPPAVLYGQPGANGGWGTPGSRSTGFGSMQQNYREPDKTFGLNNYVELASYRVIGTALGRVSLAVCPDRIGGFRFVEMTLIPQLGQNTPVTIQVFPKNAKPSSCTPVNNGPDVPTRTTLSWTGGLYTPDMTFDVYLDTVNPPVQKVAGGQPTAIFSPSPLLRAQRYYWQVVAVYSNGEAPGPVWSFVTRIPGDCSGDGYVNVGDLQLLVTAWGSSSSSGGNWSSGADLNEDGYVNIGDLQLLTANWGRSM